MGEPAVPMSIGPSSRAPTLAPMQAAMHAAAMRPVDASIARASGEPRGVGQGQTRWWRAQQVPTQNFAGAERAAAPVEEAPQVGAQTPFVGMPLVENPFFNTRQNATELAPRDLYREQQAQEAAWTVQAQETVRAQRAQEAAWAQQAQEAAQARRLEAEWARQEQQARAAHEQKEAQGRHEAGLAALQAQHEAKMAAHQAEHGARMAALRTHPTPSAPDDPRRQAGGPQYKMRHPDPPGFAVGIAPSKPSVSVTVEDYTFAILQYCAIYEAALQDNGVTPQHLVMLMGQQLEGAAKEWYKQLYIRDPGQFALQGVDNWLASVRQKFADPNVELVTRKRLRDLKMGREPRALGNYIAEFNECIMLLGRADQEQMKFEFMQQLVESARMECARWSQFQGCTLFELQQMLERVELAKRSAAFYSFAPHPMANLRHNATPMELGSVWAEPPPPPPPRTAATKPNKGPSKPKETAAPNPEKALRDARFAAGECFHCGEAGHRRAECPHLVVATPEN